MSRTLVISFLLSIFVILSAFSYLNRNSTEEVDNLRIGEDLESGDVDRDGDGSPDWLEELAGTDPNDKKSFPYKTKVGELNQIKVEPGELSITSEEVDSLTDEGLLQILRDGEEYFIERLSLIGSDENFVIKVDDNVDRLEVFYGINKSLDIFLDEVEEPIIDTVERIVTKDKSGMVILQNSNFVCKRAVSVLPKSIPSDVAEEYIEFAQTINNICYAVSLFINDDNVINLLNISIKIGELSNFPYERIENGILNPLIND